MFSIAYYFNIKSLSSQIFKSDLDEGNPGTGGTQYLFLLTVKYLNQIYGKEFAVLLNNDNRQFTDQNICTGYAKDELDAISYCEQQGITVLVFNANVADIPDFTKISTRVKVILWAHNTLSFKKQRIAANAKCINKVVCVSESQYNNMKDSSCFYKCCYINNVYSEKFYINATLSDYSEKKVAYVGSLVPQKGVHNLLDIWKFVESLSSDIQLYIFGSGNMWNANTKVNTSTGADYFYNQIIDNKIKKLKHPENIHFMGSMGWNRISDEIKTFRLGIVNPSHYMRDETFCLAATEMETHGLAIVSRYRNDGLSSTILHNVTGFLETDDEKIAQRIVMIANDEKLAKSMGMEARIFASKFIINKEIFKWCELIIENKNNIKNKNHKFLHISHDGLLLLHDKYLQIKYLFASHKIFYLISKKLKLK